MIIISNIDENGVNINLQTRYNKDLVYVSFHDPSDHKKYFGLHSSDRMLLLQNSSNTFMHSWLSPSVDQISRTCFTFLSATKQNRVYYVMCVPACAFVCLYLFNDDQTLNQLCSTEFSF